MARKAPGRRPAPRGARSHPRQRRGDHGPLLSGDRLRHGGPPRHLRRGHEPHERADGRTRHAGHRQLHQELRRGHLARRGDCLRLPAFLQRIFGNGGRDPGRQRHQSLSLPLAQADAGALLRDQEARLRLRHQHDREPQPQGIQRLQSLLGGRRADLRRDLRRHARGNSEAGYVRDICEDVSRRC